jgi:hypothetical protein
LGEKNYFLKKLADHYFWDVDSSKMDPKASKRLIIERVFSLGTIEDMKRVVAYYGRENVVEELSKLNYLDPKTLNFVSILFDKPKREFKCYTSELSRVRHWSS